MTIQFHSCASGGAPLSVTVRLARPRFMNLREQLEKQLETAPETEINGVVSASGVSGGSGASPMDPWTLLVSFSGWKQREGVLQKSELTLRKDVAREEITRIQNRVRPFDVLRVRRCRIA